MSWFEVSCVNVLQKRIEQACIAAGIMRWAWSPSLNAALKGCSTARLRVGRTLLSAAFAVVFDSGLFLSPKPALLLATTQPNYWPNVKINTNGGGQECPPHIVM